VSALLEFCLAQQQLRPSMPPHERVLWQPTFEVSPSPTMGDIGCIARAAGTAAACTPLETRATPDRSRHGP